MENTREESTKQTMVSKNMRPHASDLPSIPGSQSSLSLNCSDSPHGEMIRKSQLDGFLNRIRNDCDTITSLVEPPGVEKTLKSMSTIQLTVNYNENYPQPDLPNNNIPGTIDYVGQSEAVDKRIGDHQTKLTEKMEVAFADVQKKIDLPFAEKSIDFDKRFEAYVDERINEKMLDLRRDIASNLVKAGQDIDQKIQNCQEKLNEKIPNLLDEYLSKKELDFGDNSVFSTKIKEVVDESLHTLKDELSANRASLDELKPRVGSLENMVRHLADLNGHTLRSAPPVDLKELENKLEAQATQVTMLQQQLQSNNKTITSLETKSRRYNVTMDGMKESKHENLLSKVCHILARFVPHFHRNWIDCIHRLGKFYPKRSPRRILIKFTTLSARERVLGCASAIARAGRRGSRIFINEDLSKENRRKRSDIHKYVKFLRDRQVEAKQIGEGVLIGETLNHYDDLKNMKNGYSLKDSCTVYKCGVVAFQSTHSPLSNLFQSPIKRNGIVYKSAEHAFQHAKALANKDFPRAQNIVNEPCPYKARAIGKCMKITKDWRTKKQLSVMEEIIYLKYDQVPEFSECLKATSNHHLVENARCAYWGSGTAYNDISIYEGNYAGRNHMGRILERVCDNV